MHSFAILIVLWVVAFVILANTITAVYVSFVSGNLDKALEKMGDIALGAFIGFLAQMGIGGPTGSTQTGDVNMTADPPAKVVQEGDGGDA